MLDLCGDLLKADSQGGPWASIGMSFDKSFLVANTDRLPHLQAAPEAGEVQQSRHTSNHNGSQCVEGHQLECSG